MTSTTTMHRIKRLVPLLLLLTLTMAFVMPAAAYAQDSGKTVRAGWYDSTYNSIDASGRRSGYAYEYQLKLAAYTGWTYEYVSGSWSELMQMLENGEIDLMSDVSYTPEREKNMLFASLPMGAEEYYLFAAPSNQDIDSRDYSTLDGKRVGVNKGSIQVDFYKEWAEQNDVQAELVEVTCSEDESLQMLANGELDAYVTVDSFVEPGLAAPVCRVGSSDYYFVVSKSRPDLLGDLNDAMNKIQEENPYYNQQMFEKHIKQSEATAYLSSDEAKWLSEHGTIRVGYQDNYLAFCAADKATGELVGALRDYLAYAADCMPHERLDFQAKAYPTAASAMDALSRGEVDCVFPANLSAFDGETLGVVMTPSLMNTDVYAIIRQADQKTFAKKDRVVVAVNEGNPNYDAFLQAHFPEWEKVYYPTTDDCLNAVADNMADCVLISNYRYNNIARLCEKQHLTTFNTGVGIDYCIAVSSGETELYSILSKIIGQVPSSTVNAALSYYNAEEAKTTFTDFVMDNLPVVMAAIAIVMLVILALMVRSMRAERKANELISATETDELTGLYNRGFFFQYANHMYHEHPETPMDAIVLNIDQFHSVNALNGREFGDEVLRTLGNEVRAVSNDVGGIAGRFEADRFDIYCQHTDEYSAIFDRLQGKLDSLASNVNIRLRMGVMPWQTEVEPVQLFDRARTACGLARENYTEHLVVFDEKLREREMYDQRLLNDLRRALDECEFEVHYQPKFDIQCEPPTLVSAEALVRWRHPDLGMIPPNNFIPLLERNGQIGHVDKFVWGEAARQIARWRDQYGIMIPISVNLSRVDVFDPTLEDTFDEILLESGLSHDVLKLEVTESAYTENADQVIQVVESLHRKGYEVEMDDFGTGYSSLNMLSAMPIDVLKMDRAFIQNIEHDDKDIQLVALIIGIANSLKIPVVAEGVETKDQMILLKDLGCAVVQGYYFSRPLPAADFETSFIKEKQLA